MQFERIADKKRLHFICSEFERALPASSRILDVGCGNGIIAKGIAEKGFQVDAIDVSEKTISTAIQLNSHPNIEYRVVAAGDLRPSPQKYHGIICSEVLEHLHQPSPLLNILHTSLKNNGILVVTVPNGFGPREVFVTKPVQYLQRKNNLFTRMVFLAKRLLGYTGTTVQSSAADLGHVQFFTINALTKLAASNGFQITTIRKTNFVEQVFPFSLIAKRSLRVQQLDCAIAERLPLSFTSGFMMVWKKLV
jgi:2-polyprenyl-3-methyl-5-hydroxy-6-metoxy-1,4-benzoquinol methylase